jgi:PAS domain S-box-containing protein
MKTPLKILVIEDNPSDFLFLERHLKSQGLVTHLHCVASQEELTSALTAGGWDVVLSDYHVPGLDFHQLLGQLQKHDPDLPVIMVSGSMGEDNAVELLKLGVWDFVLKERPKRLASVIERSLRDATTRQAQRATDQALQDSRRAALNMMEDAVEARKRAEQMNAELRQSEEQFRTMFEMASIGMAQADPHTGRFLRVNQKMCAITGYSAEELLQKRVRDITHPDDRAADGQLFQRVIRGAQPDYQIEKRYIRKDGALIWVNINMTVIRSAQGRPLRTMATIEDISERKHVAVALQESEARYRTVVDNVREVIFQTNAQGLWTLLNKAWEEITGFPVAESLGTLSLNYVHPDDRQRNQELFQPLIERKKDYCRHEIRYLTKTGGLRWIEVHARLTLNERDEVTGTAGTLRDVTELKQLGEEREITVRLLSLMNAAGDWHELMRQVTLLLHDCFDCEAVGIRLRDGHDFPYFETRGFPPEFVQMENQLCRQDANGQTILDGEGNPVLECMCGNVLCGRFNPEKPFFTARGSFWANDTTRLLATTTPADRQANTRNRCNSEGYESVALVALRVGATTHGLIQLNDKRKNRFTPERIALLERLADSLAIGLAHRQDQVRLRDSEEQYRHLVDNASEAIYVAQNGIIRFANRACAQLTGYGEVELIGKRSAAFAVPAEQDRVGERQRRLAHGETLPDREEFRVRFRDGVERWISLSSVQILWKDQPATLNFAADITERKRAETALQTSEARYRLLFESASDAITLNILLPDGRPGRFVEANDLACRQLGYTRDELLQKGPFDIMLIHTDEQHRAIRQQLEGSGAALFETINVGKDGRHIPVEVNAHQFVLGGEKFILAVARDLSERKQAAQTLQLQGAALAAAANAIVITDTTGAIEWANPAFTTFTGYTLDEVRGKNPRDLLKSGQHDASFYRIMWEIILAGNVWHGEMINRRKDGTLYTEEMTITPLRNTAGAITHFIAIKQDITERKNLEAQLLRTQRLESVGRLASGIAHDLNNILAPMLMAPPLLREAIQDPDARSLVDTIESSAQRGANIIKQLLTFGRGLKGERIPLQLRTLVREMLKLIAETFPKNIATRTEIFAELPLVTGDATQLHQVLMNLSVNARDAMPAGGTLTFSLTPAMLDAAAAAACPEAKPGRYVVLGVSDTGTGIAPENLEKIFDPFFTTKAIGEGTGLGLSTVLGIVRSHGGFVRVQSTIGQGTCFRVYLPITETPEVAVATDAAIPPPQGRGELVLVVDDEADVRHMTRRMLETNGYRVVEAQDGFEGMVMLENLRQPVQIVLTDLLMPRMDGLAFIRTVRRKNTRLPILIAGGLPPTSDALGELGLSAQSFLAKPFTSAALLKALRHALG